MEKHVEHRMGGVDDSFGTVTVVNGTDASSAPMPIGSWQVTCRFGQGTTNYTAQIPGPINAGDASSPWNGKEGVQGVLSVAVDIFSTSDHKNRIGGASYQAPAGENVGSVTFTFSALAVGGSGGNCSASFEATSYIPPPAPPQKVEKAGGHH